MKKNVVFWTGVQKERFSEKYGGFEWMEMSKKTWEFWCAKNDCIFFHYDSPTHDDFFEYRITWQRWFDVFDKLEQSNIEYDKILMVDACTMIKWDTPNIFDLVDDRMVGWRDMDNMKWIFESINGYNEFFNKFSFDLAQYINAGFVIINKKHKSIFSKFKEFYETNKDKLISLQDEIVKKGTDQTPFNYWLQINNVDVNFNLPISFRLSHIHRKDMLGYNWQIDEDETPFFLKYSYVWQFNGFPKNERTNLMGQVWKLIKHNYMLSPNIDAIIESIGEDKHTNITTTSNQFKIDVWNYFKDFKNKIAVELGTHKGQTTKVLSYCFKKVFTINREERSFKDTKKLNVGLDNIKYVPFDLYSSNELPVEDSVSMFLIDAGHLYENVVMDINRCLGANIEDECYIVFDDYGMNIHRDQVKRAVDEFIGLGKIEIIKKIGHEPGHIFDKEKNRVLEDYEGLICKVVK